MLMFDLWGASENSVKICWEYVDDKNWIYFILNVSMNKISLKLFFNQFIVPIKCKLFNIFMTEIKMPIIGLLLQNHQTGLTYHIWFLHPDIVLHDRSSIASFCSHASKHFPQKRIKRETSNFILDYIKSHCFSILFP